jgi:FixJ family two-component response regulator
MMTDKPIAVVIDDDASIREALDSLLRSIGVQTKLFATPDEFLKSAPPDAPCCLILDVRLPGRSGIDFLEELTKEKIDIPVIFITGHGDISMSVRAMKAGAVEFLTKPFREQDMLDAVQLGLERDRTRREREVVLTDLRQRFNSLTLRERQVLTLVATGLRNKQIAADIGIKEITVKVHRSHGMTKMGAKSLVDLVWMADQLGLPRTRH